MKRVMVLLVAGAVLSGVAAYVAAARSAPARQGQQAALPPQ